MEGGLARVARGEATLSRCGDFETVSNLENGAVFRRYGDGRREWVAVHAMWGWLWPSAPCGDTGCPGIPLEMVECMGMALVRRCGDELIYQAPAKPGQDCRPTIALRRISDSRAQPRYYYEDDGTHARGCTP